MLFLTLAVLIVTPRQAYAYINPGAGSLVYQTLLAVIVGLGFVLRSARAWIAGFVRDAFRRRGRPSKPARDERP
jgi:hypothetical protein